MWKEVDDIYFELGFYPSIHIQDWKSLC